MFSYVAKSGSSVIFNVKVVLYLLSLFLDALKDQLWAFIKLSLLVPPSLSSLFTSLSPLVVVSFAFLALFVKEKKRWWRRWLFRVRLREILGVLSHRMNKMNRTNNKTLPFLRLHVLLLCYTNIKEHAHLYFLLLFIPVKEHVTDRDTDIHSNNENPQSNFFLLSENPPFHSSQQEKKWAHFCSASPDEIWARINAPPTCHNINIFSTPHHKKDEEAAAEANKGQHNILSLVLLYLDLRAYKIHFTFLTFSADFLQAPLSYAWLTSHHHLP